MPYLFVRHKVEDYARWKSAFDDFTATRKAAGEKSYQLCRIVDDPNNIVVMNEWDNVDNLRKFMQSPELQEAMQRAGVSEQPEIHILEEIEKGSI